MDAKSSKRMRELLFTQAKGSYELAQSCLLTRQRGLCLAKYGTLTCSIELIKAIEVHVDTLKQNRKTVQ